MELPVKIRTFEKVLRFLEEKNKEMQTITHTKNQFSNESSDLKKLKSSDESNKKSIDSLKSINSLNEMNSGCQTMNISKSLLHNNLSGVVKSEHQFHFLQNANYQKKHSMPNFKNQMDEIVCSINKIKRNYKKKETNIKSYGKDLYCNEKPFNIIIEEEEMERLDGMAFYKK